MTGTFLSSFVLATVLAVGLVIVVGVRVADSRAWQRSLVAHRLRFPRGVEAEQVSAWLSSFQPAPKGLGSPRAVVLEVIATSAGIEHFLLVPERWKTAVTAQLVAAIPGLRFKVVPSPEVGELRVSGELRLSGSVFPLAHERVEAAGRALLASLQPLEVGQAICLQWIVRTTRTPSPERAEEALRPNRAGRVQAQKKKHAEPLLQAVARIGVAAADRAEADHVLQRVAAAWSVSEAQGATVRVRRGFRPAQTGLARRELPFIDWPLVLNAAELVGLSGVPLGELDLPGLPAPTARQLPAPAGSLNEGLVVAKSDHPGTTGQPLRLRTQDRLQHLHLLGPTGTGKSTLLAQLALQDIAAGHGAVVLDPKRDLTEAILRRVPAERVDDVVLLDPADLHRPVGLNVLGTEGDETARELVAEELLGTFASLWAESWGPRTDDVLRSALQTLVMVRAPDDSAYTLTEVPLLLSDATFRRQVLSHPGVPESLEGFWSWYGKLREHERVNITAPVMNKLRAFTVRTPLRLLLGQSQGIDLRRVFAEQKILLVPLSSGELGRPVAELLGALVVAGLWQQVRARTALPVDERAPVFIYIDEFQQVLRLPVDIGDMLVQARGLGVGLVLAHQHLGQLERDMREGVLAAARSQVVFQLGQADAKALAPSFAPYLTPDDLLNLERWQLAIRASWHGRVLRPVTGSSRPLGEETLAPEVIRKLSREAHGLARTDVEAGIRNRQGVAERSSAPPVGRRRRGGSP